MTTQVRTNPADEERKLQPFALRDAPALIEAVLPAQKVSFEAQRERKAGAGQTLTALGSYWKGRKPLILVRAIVLGSLPQTDDPEKDLEIFETDDCRDCSGSRVDPGDPQCTTLRALRRAAAGGLDTPATTEV